jgi:hypothetical protein
MDFVFVNQGFVVPSQAHIYQAILSELNSDAQTSGIPRQGTNGLPAAAAFLNEGLEIWFLQYV